MVRATRPARLPVVLTRQEVRALLLQMSDVAWLLASLLYGTGMRLMECARLRVQDVDFTRHQIMIRDGKGQKDRITMWEDGYDIRTIQKLLGHNDVSTTMIYSNIDVHGSLSSERSLCQ